MVCTNNMSRFAYTSIAILALFIGCSSEEQASLPASSGEKFSSGVHYEILDNPTTVRDPSKIEVTEVFWFGCNHCYALEPYIADWKKNVSLTWHLSNPQQLGMKCSRSMPQFITPQKL